MNERKIRNLTLWFGIGILMSPLGFNCHSRTNQAPAVGTAPRPDDADQTVREMASNDSFGPSAEDGAPQNAGKVRLTNDLVKLTSTTTATTGKNSPLNRAEIIPKGTSLLALYDNACRGKVGAVLKFEAEEIRPAQDISLADLEAKAGADECLIRVDENHVRQMVAPISETERSVFETQSKEVSALATTNDARVAEARHITFSKSLQSWDWFYSGVGITTDVIVAVIDTGVLYTHPDLIDNIYTNVQGQHGIDYVNNDNDPIDDYGHGSHVAGIIGARANNGIGVTGVMGTRVKIMAVKVLDNQGAGTDTSIANGIRYAADQGAHVINMSLGGQFTSIPIRDAMVYAVNRGVVIIVAAGNDNVLIDAAANFYAPSGYAKDIPGAIAVGSVDAVSGSRSSFSNYSTTYVHLAAPGSNGILSTYTGNTYATLQGTSMAAPVVAGAAALLVGAYRSRSISYSAADVVNLLVESSRPVASLNAVFRNGATLDIERAAKLFYGRYVMSGNGGTEVQ